MIRGTTHFGRKFEVERKTHVDGNLWVGAFTKGERVLDLRDEFDDSIEDAVPSDHIEALATKAEGLLADGPLLICCTAGINRSPLIAATVLMRRGWSANDAISHLRARRGDVVLCNPTFEMWLRERS